LLETEAAGGIFLLAATVAALVWANSPWDGSYRRAWRTRLTVPVADLAIRRTAANEGSSL
jgi:NhaA family Na+:H+ antiporter